MLAVGEGHAVNAAAIGGIAVFAGFGAFRALADELSNRTPPRPPFDGTNVVELRPKP